MIHGLALFLAAGLVLGSAFLDGALWPLAWFGVVLLAVAVEITPSVAARAGGLFLARLAGFLVSHHWLHASCLTYLTHDPVAAAGIVLALATLIAAVTQLPVALAALLFRRAAPRWWLPASWVCGEFALERFFGISFQQILDSQWSAPPVLRGVHHLGWTPTLLVCLTGAVSLGEAIARWKSRRSIPAAAAMILLGLTPLIEPHDGALRGVGVVHMPDVLHRPTTVPPDTDVLVWPEAVIPGVRELEEGSTDDGDPIDGLPDNISAGHLANVLARSRRGPLNAVVATDPRGLIRAVRGKRVLVPAGERSFFGFDPEGGGFVPGAASPIVSVGDRRVLTMLCYEVYDRSLLTSRGAALIAVMSNDRALGGSRIALQQSLGALILRAVELGVPAVRASLWGRAAIVGSDGRVLDLSAPGESGVLVHAP